MQGTGDTKLNKINKSLPSLGESKRKAEKIFLKAIIIELNAMEVPREGEQLRSLGEATEWSREGGARQVALYLPTFLLWKPPPLLKSDSIQSECCIPHLPYMTPCIVN